jgi:hypothetical protein
MTTTVVNLATDEEVYYDLPPKEAVVHAWYQFTMNDWAICDYNYETAPLTYGRLTVACGDWCAMREEQDALRMD